MNCTCVENGIPASSCLGCKTNKIINPEYQKRAQDDGFNDRQLSQIVSSVQHVLDNEKSFEISNVWIDGFLKGFEYGQQNG